MKRSVKFPFFTIGHSNRSLEEFVELLIGTGVELVADIRKVPMSRANPQFNEDTLPEALAALDVSYVHIAALGGLRGKARTLPPDVNGFWTNESFHNYADYALSAQFHAGFELRPRPGNSAGLNPALMRRSIGTNLRYPGSGLLVPLPGRGAGIAAVP